MSGFDMDGYVPVAERIDAFVTKHPDGSLQSEIVELTADRVTVKAYAYRSPDDPRPGIGHSSLDIPGKTSFTRGSEIENAETSAWGRAIASLGFEVKRGIASREEARSKQLDPGSRGASERHTRAVSAPSGPARSPEEQALLDELLALPGMSRARMNLLADAANVREGSRANADQLRDMLRIAQQPLPEHPGQAPSSRGDVGSAPAPGSPSGSVDTADPAGPPASVGGVDAPASRGEADAARGAASHSDAGVGVLGSPDSATPAAAPRPPGGAPPAAPTDAEILAAAGEGAELVPPKPGTDEYRAMKPVERAKAKAYWQARKEEEPTPAEQMRAALEAEA